MVVVMPMTKGVGETALQKQARETLGGSRNPDSLQGEERAGAAEGGSVQMSSCPCHHESSGVKL
jgi:hypothetical protein